MNETKTIDTEYVLGGGDTHKGIHVAAVVTDSNQVLASESFPTTRLRYYKATTKWFWFYRCMNHDI